jgi:flagellar hook-associated protein 1
LSLIGSLRSAAGALQVFDRALQVRQNNVANVGTPGYAKQRLELRAAPFQPESGLSGGVIGGRMEDSRDVHIERAVQREFSSWGYSAQKAASLSSLESVFQGLTGGGLPDALSNLFQSFSALAAAPNDARSRQAVLDRAGDVVESFRQTHSELVKDQRHTELQIRDAVSQVNLIAARIQDYNVQRRRLDRADAGMEARLYDDLEELSEWIDIQVLQQEDGSVTVLGGAEAPLVVGANLYPFSSVFGPNGVPSLGEGPGARILDASGNEISSTVRGGRLGALLDVRNRVLPGLLGDGANPGTLDQLAEALASRVNEVLASGVIPGGETLEPGAPLFTSRNLPGMGWAANLQVNPDLRPDLLAVHDPGPPAISNGIALRLGQLGTTEDSSGLLNQSTFAGFYGQMAAAVGRERSDALQFRDVRHGILVQARQLRDEISGISLDEEAIRLVEIQRAYQANARVVTLMNELTETAINLLR